MSTSFAISTAIKKGKLVITSLSLPDELSVRRVYRFKHNEEWWFLRLTEIEGSSHTISISTRKLILNTTPNSEIIEFKDEISNVEDFFSTLVASLNDSYKIGLFSPPKRGESFNVELILRHKTPVFIFHQLPSDLVEKEIYTSQGEKWNLSLSESEQTLVSVDERRITINSHCNLGLLDFEHGYLKLLEDLVEALNSGSNANHVLTCVLQRESDVRVRFPTFKTKKRLAPSCKRPNKSKNGREIVDDLPKVQLFTSVGQNQYARHKIRLLSMPLFLLERLVSYEIFYKSEWYKVQIDISARSEATIDLKSNFISLPALCATKRKNYPPLQLQYKGLEFEQVEEWLSDFLTESLDELYLQYVRKFAPIEHLSVLPIVDSEVVHLEITGILDWLEPMKKYYFNYNEEDCFLQLYNGDRLFVGRASQLKNSFSLDIATPYWKNKNVAELNQLIAHLSTLKKRWWFNRLEPQRQRLNGTYLFSKNKEFVVENV